MAMIIAASVPYGIHSISTGRMERLGRWWGMIWCDRSNANLEPWRSRRLGNGWGFFRGLGAVNIGLRHLDTFGTLFSHSGYFTDSRGHGFTGADVGWNYFHKHLSDFLSYVGQQFSR